MSEGQTKRRRAGASKPFEPVGVVPEDPRYPARLSATSGQPGSEGLTALGNLTLLTVPKLGFFCSVRCPGNLILQTYDLARGLRDAAIPVIGGFHSPMEKECLALLIRGTQPVVICPARSINSMRVPATWKKPLQAGSLLVLSPFGETSPRITAETARARNAFVIALAQCIFLAHAGPASRTEDLCKRALAAGKPVWTLHGAENEHLLRLGAAALKAGEVVEMWRSHQTAKATSSHTVSINGSSEAGGALQ